MSRQDIITSKYRVSLHSRYVGIYREVEHGVQLHFGASALKLNR